MSRLQEFKFLGPVHGGSPIVDRQFGVATSQMGAHGVYGDDERVCDFLIRKPIS